MSYLWTNIDPLPTDVIMHMQIFQEQMLFVQEIIRIKNICHCTITYFIFKCGYTCVASYRSSEISYYPLEFVSTIW